MNHEEKSADILNLLNKALARELQVSVQYMLQYATWAGRESAGLEKTSNAKQVKYIASHALYFLPVATLKKVAITEMRHAEAIAERLVVLGGEPTTQPDDIITGKTAKAMLENGAIELYEHIIDVAGIENDDVMKKMFQWLLSDEVKHHREFTKLLGET